jgi:probable rRNA maturation factor
MECSVRDLQDATVPTELPRIAACAALEAVDGSALDRLDIILVDDERMHDLNLRFRGQDKPTDVLSFEPDLETGEGALRVGEIIISVPTARRQADEAGVALDAELAWLAAHGALHVSGMDDASEEELSAMVAIQHRVFASLGLERHS